MGMSGGGRARRLAAAAAALLLWLAPARAAAQIEAARPDAATAESSAIAAAGNGGGKLVATPAEKFAIAPGGVDMRTGQYAYRQTDLSLGDLTLTRRMELGIPVHVKPFGNFAHEWDIAIVESRVNLYELNYQPQSGDDYRIVVHVGSAAETFDSYAPATAGFTQVSQAGYAKLSFTGDKAGPDVVYTFQSTDGTLYDFRPLGSGDCQWITQRCALVSRIVRPDGTILTMQYEAGPHLRSVTSSRGYTLLLETGGGPYVVKACVLNLAVAPKPASNVCPAGAQATATYAYIDYQGTRLASVTDPGGGIARFTYGGTADALVMGFIKPGQTAAWLTNRLSPAQDIEERAYEKTDSQAFADGQSYAYAFFYAPANAGEAGPIIAGGTFTDALDAKTTVKYGFPILPGTAPGEEPPCTDPPCALPMPGDNLGVYQHTSGPILVTDPLDRTTSAAYCNPETSGLPEYYVHRCYAKLLQWFFDPARIQTLLSYDSHRNVIQVRRKAKPDTGLPDIVTSMSFACLDFRSCAKPTQAVDADGNVTDWTYSPDHGGVLTETKPAPSPTAVRPQTRYSYAQRYAWIANGAGAYVRAATPVWIPTATSSCMTGGPAAGGGCALAGDEVVTSYDYGPDSGPNTLLLRGEAVTAGGVTLRTCYAYDARGNRISETGPRANLASCPAAAPAAAADFTTSHRFDAEGQETGTIAPDPDGAGPLKYAATRTSYDPAGRPFRVETGELAAWQSEAVAPSAWTGFAVITRTDTEFDALDRKVKETQSGAAAPGGTLTAQGVTQYSYDRAGRLDCTAVRMNPAAWGSPPPSACTLGPQGAAPNDYGPDRIARNFYDRAGQLIRTAVAYGTADQADERVMTYSATGQILTLADGENNLTSYDYDGQDRLLATRFPVPAKGALASSATDYEQYGYDPNGNRISLRKRDGSLLTYQYDGLNRMKAKLVPGRTGLTPAQTRDVYYDYDLRGLQTKARFDSLAGEGVTTAYDGFGRVSSSTTSMGGFTRTLTYAWDADGNRIRLTHPDLAVFGFDYDGLDRMTLAHDKAVATTTDDYIIRYWYRQSGRRQSAVRGAGTIGFSTNYYYDAALRLSTLANTLPFPGAGLVLDLAYNPAGQIVRFVRSNDSYAWRGAYTVSRPYAANGLNQYSAAGSAAFLYDPNGNLIRETTPAATRNYVYDVENRLVSASGAASASLVYDPLGRLFQTSGGSAGVRQFLYDGDALVAEYNGTGALLKRYVHGSGVDEAVAQYDGTTVGLSSRRYMLPDERGSIAALVKADGSPSVINTYDEYGIPGTANDGRFQYTGQAWIAELGMYYYKARIYSPTLGRFLQVDPIGYEDQVNLYAYVGNDPANAADPLGMDTRVTIMQHGYHAFVVLQDTKNRLRVVIVRGGPNESYVGHYSSPAAGSSSGSSSSGSGSSSARSSTGASSGSSSDQSRSSSSGKGGRDGLQLVSEVRPVEQSADRNSFLGGKAQTVGSTVIKTDFRESVNNANQFTDAVNSANLDYKLVGQNSNSFAGTAYEQVTGQSRPDNPNWTPLPAYRIDLCQQGVSCPK